MIRVLIAEDSVTTRELLVAILRSDPGVEIVGEAKSGREAVEMTKRLRPDVITMDIRMPEMDGFEASRQIMVEAPTPIVIVSGSVDVHEIGVSMDALRAGALTVLSKPSGPEAPDFEENSRRFVDTIKAMSQVKVVRRWAEHAPTEPPPRTPVTIARNGAPPRVVAIAASTGGPGALARILSELPGDFPLPVLVVQHITPGFVEGFAAWLNAAAFLRVKVAEDGEPLSARTVYIAPDDRHLGVRDASTISVANAPPVDGFRPSGTFLFESVARVFGSSAMAVILTGMGRDGVVGLRAVRQAGGRILAQDEASSVVFGMPGAAVSEGLADASLPLDTLAYRIRDLVEPSIKNGAK